MFLLCMQILITPTYKLPSNKYSALKLTNRRLAIGIVYAMPPKPRKELDSKRLQNSLRANVLPLVSLCKHLKSFTLNHSTLVKNATFLLCYARLKVTTEQ